MIVLERKPLPAEVLFGSLLWHHVKPTKSALGLQLYDEYFGFVSSKRSPTLKPSMM
jgi:hypothetical protein